MRLQSFALLAAVLPACAHPVALGPPRQGAPPLPWQDLDRTCARGDDPRHLERVHVDDGRRELLVVPVRIQRSLAVPRSWTATGSEDPDITPFRWRRARVEGARATSGRAMIMDIEHVSRDTLSLALRLDGSAVSGWVAHARLERRATGELVAALGGSWFTDIPPWGGHWSDLAGELRISDDPWHEPGKLLGVHLEVSSGRATLCGQFRLAVPPPGERRRISIPYAFADPHRSGDGAPGDP